MSAYLQFNVTHQSIKRTDTFEPVAKSQNYLTAGFNFTTEEWDNLIPTAIFRNNNTAYEVVLDQAMECEVPWEVLNTTDPYVLVSVFAGDLITVDQARVYIASTGYGDDLETSEDPTPSVYAQIMDRLYEVESTVEEAEQSANNSADTALDAKDDAISARDDAISAKNTAVSSANTATSAETNAQLYASNALSSANSASNSKDLAVSSASSASTSASNASRDANSASTYASNASESARQAGLSAQSAHEDAETIDTKISQMEDYVDQKTTYIDGGLFTDWE